MNEAAVAQRPAPEHEPRFQFDLRQMIAATLAGSVIWALASGLDAWSQRTVFLLWSLVACVQFVLGRWARVEPPRADPNRADAYELVALVARFSLLIWLLFSLTLGAAHLLADNPQPAVNLVLNVLSIPLAIWLVVTIVACFVSLLLYFEWRDLPLLAMRIWAPLSVVLPLSWFLINRT